MSVLTSLSTCSLGVEPFITIWRKSRLRGKIVVLMYHEVLEDSYPGTAWTVVKESEFIKQMVYLHDHYEVISLEKALSMMKQQVFTTTPYAVLTFDDGYSGNKRIILPIIERLRIPVTIFAATKAIKNQQPYWYDIIINKLDELATNTIQLDLGKFGLGFRVFEKTLLGEQRWDKIQHLLTDLKSKLPEVRIEIVEFILRQTAKLNENHKPPIMPMTIEDIKALAASQFVTIGAHSHAHDILIQIPAKEIFCSIETSRNLLSEWVGKPVEFFSYPNGDYNEQIIDILEDLGFVCGLTTHTRLWKSSDSAFEIPRIGIGRYDSFGSFKKKVSGFLR